MQPFSNRALFVLFLCLGVGGVLGSCGGNGGEEDSEWTVHEGALTLERDLFVSETESFYFGSVHVVGVADDGRIFVLDWDASHIKVLDAEGTLRQTIGRKGEGPGEFQKLGRAVLSRGDSLYVLDDDQNRILVFGPSGDFAYGVQANVKGAPMELMVPEDSLQFLLAHTESFSDTSDIAPLIVRRLDPSRKETDTLFVAEGMDIYRPKDWFYLVVPFSPRPRLQLGPEGRVHYARGDSLSVTTYGINGARETAVSIPFQLVPVSEEERAEIVEQSSKGPSIPASEIPSTKPAFNHFLVDDRGRYWFGRPTAHPDTTEWWLAWPDQKRVATTRLSDDVNLQVVRDGFAYGGTRTETGTPALVRYRIRDSSN